jgi:hypothetical protein
MRKYIAIPLLILYLITMSGLWVQLHFCGNKLNSWQIASNTPQCCCESDKDNAEHHSQAAINTDDDCCSNKVITLKINADQQTANSIYWELQSVSLALVPAIWNPTPYQALLTHQDKAFAHLSNAPPLGLWQNIPLYKLHVRYTYYG